MSQCKTALKYFDVSNKHDLKSIEEMFDENITYETVILGIKKQGKTEVMEMMKKFFSDVSDVHWDVEKYALDTSFDGHHLLRYHVGDAVLLYFLRTSSNETFNNKKGREWICVNDKNLIYHIRVEPIPEK